MEILHIDAFKSIFKFLNSTNDILNLRLVCKNFYFIFEKKIPFYFNKKRIGNIFLKENIIWMTMEKKKIKEIIFKKYGVIETKIYDYKIFNTRINYDLPLKINKNVYKNYEVKKTEFDIDKNKIKEEHYGWYMGTNGTPACNIS